MDGLLKDSFYKDSTFAIVNPKNIFKGDAFQVFAYFVECINGRRDILENIKRSMHLSTDYVAFKYAENEVRVYNDFATFHTPRIEIKLTHKEFRRWAARYLAFRLVA